MVENQVGFFMQPDFHFENLVWAKLKGGYAHHGFAIIRNVFNNDFIECTRRHIFSILEKHPDIEPEKISPFLLAEDSVWMSWTKNERLLKIAEQFLGPNLALYFSNLFCKPPKTGLAIAWHQDAPYWTLEPMEVISVWVAVTDTPLENGGMQVIPGSHRGRVFPLVEDRDSKNAFGRTISAGQVDESQALAVQLRAGDISLHHPRLIHGSPPNFSEAWRIGMAFRYIPTTVKITDPKRATPFLLRGKAIPGCNHFQPWPIDKN
jgi:hypothetical protein